MEGFAIFPWLGMHFESFRLMRPNHVKSIFFNTLVGRHPSVPETAATQESGARCLLAGGEQAVRREPRQQLETIPSLSLGGAFPARPARREAHAADAPWDKADDAPPPRQGQDVRQMDPFGDGSGERGR